MSEAPSELDVIGTRDFDRGFKQMGASLLRVVKLMPPPRHLFVDFGSPYPVKETMKTIAEFQARREGLDSNDICSAYLNDDHSVIPRLVINGLKTSGSRVGPFSRRKIKKYVLLSNMEICP